VEKVVMEYGDMLFRVCMVLLCNEQDAQDAVQDTFCSYMEHAAGFRNREHEKAWLIRVATNRWEDADRYCEFPEQSEVLAELMNLPEQLKTVIYLHYIEGYKAAEIAGMLGITLNAVKKRMQRGREKLKLSLGGEHALSPHA